MRRQRDAGLSLVEVVVATAVLAISSLALVNGFTATTVSSIESDRSLRIQSSLQTCYESLHDVPYSQLLSWNGVVSNHLDHRVTVTAHLLRVGLIQLELTASDARTGVVLARLATLRSGEG